MIMLKGYQYKSKIDIYIIEKNNGMINCKSEIGNGTEFIVKYMK